ncbi:septum site-determining protein MinC [Ketobacter sp. MCCC 1A13808]|uniref:septum site-determining protein MinC n=1 Tax=Ketobacter sp. MCCC 1A13808 TaxID=2602738 RepID=UPI000F10FCAA|nr:septum site-determining protein MinC [Ketobacter sp. MCCC 1A13808]MVF11378.1 septum site-determining protein MinC [Ketobacter sp. MCCC 1A13808]RLP54680.1 MAG: septum site-determining protein MinC [Ketobacter sp.]
MLDTEAAIDTEACFKLKGSRVTMTILELYRYDYQSFNDALSAKVSTAPDFFQQTPVILSLEKCANDEFVDFIELSELCREFGMVPVAIRGGTEQQAVSANVAGLPILPPATSSRQTQPAKPATEATNELEIVEEEVPATANKIITTPIRSGQQIYAPGGDLVVIAPVSAGAEILADGNIHVYGPLRGRALAGVKGDASARVFCQQLEAELISIAGNYKVNEDLRGEHWKQAIRAHLEGDQLIISPL